jgi:hypothetical protein
VELFEVGRVLLDAGAEGRCSEVNLAVDLAEAVAGDEADTGALCERREDRSAIRV